MYPSLTEQKRKMSHDIIQIHNSVMWDWQYSTEHSIYSIWMHGEIFYMIMLVAENIVVHLNNIMHDGTYGFGSTRTSTDYSLTSLIRHSFKRHPRYHDTFFAWPNSLVQNSIFYTTTTLVNATLEYMFCHIKEVINAKIPFI